MLDFSSIGTEDSENRVERRINNRSDLLKKLLILNSFKFRIYIMSNDTDLVTGTSSLSDSV